MSVVRVTREEILQGKGATAPMVCCDDTGGLGPLQKNQLEDAMSKTEFTPGPWGFFKCDFDEKYLVDTPEDRLPHMDADDPYSYAPVATVADQGLDSGLANAHLIAAAPDLYEALEDALSFIEKEYANHMTWPDVYRTIEAALVKARGEGWK